MSLPGCRNTIRHVPRSGSPGDIPHEMAELLGSHSVLLELGSGSSIKIRLLLEAVRPRIYVPMDISREHLIDAAQALARDYPWLTVHAACVDYSQPWACPISVRAVIMPFSRARVSATSSRPRPCSYSGRSGDWWAVTAVC